MLLRLKRLPRFARRILRWPHGTPSALLLQLVLSTSLAACADMRAGGWPLGFAGSAMAASSQADADDTVAGSYLAGRYALAAGDFAQAADTLP